MQETDNTGPSSESNMTHKNPNKQTVELKILDDRIGREIPMPE